METTIRHGCYGENNRMRTQELCKTLEETFPKFLTSLELTTDVYSELLRTELITWRMMIHIQNAPLFNQKVLRLMKIINNKVLSDKKHFFIFCEVLRKTSQAALAKLMLHKAMLLTVSEQASMKDSEEATAHDSNRRIMKLRRSERERIHKLNPDDYGVILQDKMALLMDLIVNNEFYANLLATYLFDLDMVERIRNQVLFSDKITELCRLLMLKIKESTDNFNVFCQVLSSNGQGPLARALKRAIRHKLQGIL